MRVSLIVAMTGARVIGRAGTLPWRLPADLARFKRLTMGHAIVMGRRTYESIGRPLPGRTTVVVSRRPEYRVPGAMVVPGLPQALEAAAGGDEVFIVGGGELYREALPLADRLYLTTVHAECEGDAHFPPLDLSQWRLLEETRHAADDRNAHDTTFAVYERRK